MNCIDFDGFLKIVIGVCTEVICILRGLAPTVGRAEQRLDQRRATDRVTAPVPSTESADAPLIDATIRPGTGCRGDRPRLKTAISVAGPGIYNIYCSLLFIVINK